MFNITDGFRAGDVAAARLTNPGAVGSSTTPGMAEFVFSLCWHRPWNGPIFLQVFTSGCSRSNILPQLSVAPQKLVQRKKDGRTWRSVLYWHYTASLGDLFPTFRGSVGLEDLLTPKMKAVRSFETSVCNYRVMQRRMPTERRVQLLPCEKSKPAQKVF